MADFGTALDRMLARVGKTREEFRATSLVGRAFRRQGVSRTAELDRVLALPSRRWQDDPDLEAVRAAIGAWLGLPPPPGGCPKWCACGGAGRMELFPIQAKALEELHDFGGLLAPMPVGAGKTAVSFLAPVVMGAERPLLLIPAKLRNKTRRDFKMLARHWIGHPGLAILSYEEISRDAGEGKLRAANPDLIVADEIHRAKNRKAGCTRKIARWMREHPETRCALMSGTMTTRSIREYDHLAKWACKKLSPLPRRSEEAGEWADATDAKVTPDRRLAPGALLGLCSSEELDAIAKDMGSATSVVRGAYCRRLVSTPSVVASGGDELGVSLQISGLMDIQLEPEVLAAFAKLRADWETPCGDAFSEAVDLWRHARELAAGFVYHWDPPAPQDWLEARREWARYVREILSRGMKGLDTEFQVAKAVVNGRLQSQQYWDWGEIRDTFKPHSVPVWIGKVALERAAEWMEEAPGIVWVEHVAAGNRLAEMTGRPYFGEGCMSGGMHIEQASGSIIASIASCSEGVNLQHNWSRNFVLSPPPTGRIWEQMIGRTHRKGQDADEVSFDVALVCREQWEGLQQAFADERYVHETTGEPRKLLYADLDLPDETEARRLALNPAWSK